MPSAGRPRRAILKPLAINSQIAGAASVKHLAKAPVWRRVEMVDETASLQAMSWTTLLMVLIVFCSSTCHADESKWLKRPPPSFEQQQSVAAEMAKNDGLLRQGDIIATDRGFLVFKGVAADGYTNEFAPLPNPLNAGRFRTD